MIGSLIAAVLGILTPWKTLHYYKSQEGMFSINFPFWYSMHVNEARVEDTNTFHSVTGIIELDAPGKPTPYILIGYSHTIGVQTVDSYIRDSSECDPLLTIHPEHLTVSGEEARLYNNVVCGNAAETRVYIVHGDTAYTITVRKTPSDEADLREILAHFHFIQPT